MARPKKNESAVLVEIVNDYYAHEANGDIRKLKYSNLARYAEKRGIQAAWYDFQRDEAVVRRIEELSALCEKPEGPSVVPAYKSLDIEALLNRCNTVEELTRQLYELDCYWKKTYDDAVMIAAKDRSLVAKAQTLERSNTELSEKLDEAECQVKALQRENVYLRRMLRENLYPAVANELLRASHLPVPENETVNPDAFPHLIEGEVPQPLGGIQQPQPRKLTRQEQLLADMREQVQKHGK